MRAGTALVDDLERRAREKAQQDPDLLTAVSIHLRALCGQMTRTCAPEA
jgi:hypothetical protein